ncbi:hypothetical protein PFICI_08006 [Pestalotiopsis fici W106-1]|uniref:Uncharacterized protein n=1 Tax=Pestalotiopsis fici (strain W106-1 / CGMCC3.15140) TaxID=1229662 RepID=W3X4Z0_PESFW|nr:uncharacterized protein PFICI_08006 [Pestalotiopsis fici W106-1]ETS80477.1 hypothetical protein PFICI_08006 [Pestalotiopsis fici W106-1]
MFDIDLGLARPDDDANEKKIISVLNDLVHDRIDAVTAARTIDEIITEDCQKTLVAYNSASKEQKKNGTVSGPSPQGWQHYLYDCLATAAMKVPAAHPGQDRLVNLIDQLGRLPRHKVPALYSDSEQIVEKELWVLNRENHYDGFGQWMWERHEGTFVGWRQVEMDPDAADAYLNFSAFLARLLSGGVAALLGLSALVLPFIRRNITVAASHEPHKFEPYVAAAAQWILYSGKVLYTMCEIKVMASVRWKKELWDRIKTQFDTINGDGRFCTETRDWAAQAADFMRKVEETGSVRETDAFQRHHFLSLEEEQEGSADE